MMKRILSVVILLALAAVMCLSFASCGDGGSGDAVTLYVYNWGEYISDGFDGTLDVNREFEIYCREELGMNVKVNYSTFSSNEDMYAKVSSGAAIYDVLIPSDYMIQRMISEERLRPLNMEKIEFLSPHFNGKLEAHLVNGERILISRQYVRDLKAKLSLGKEG